MDSGDLEVKYPSETRFPPGLTKNVLEQSEGLSQVCEGLTRVRFPLEPPWRVLMFTTNSEVSTRGEKVFGQESSQRGQASWYQRAFHSTK